MHKLTVPIMIAGALATWLGLNSREFLPPAAGIAEENTVAAAAPTELAARSTDAPVVTVAQESTEVVASDEPVVLKNTAEPVPVSLTSAAPEQPDVVAGDLPPDKEEQLRERFGVVRRQGRWIPTVGGGTNLVYITTGLLPPALAGNPYAAQLQATSGLPPYRWELLEGRLPAGLALDEATGAIGGMADAPMSAEITVGVTDARGARDAAGFLLHVQPEQPLAIVTESLPGALIGGEFLFQLEAAGGLPPYVWSLEGDAESAGLLQIDPLTGLLYGVIDAAVPEVDLPLLIRLEDAQLQVTREIFLRCRVGLSIVELPLAPLYAHESFTFDFSAVGGREPYSWVAAALPPGLELASTGVLRGWPTTTGDYMAEIWVQDADGQVDAARCLLAVRDPDSAAVARFAALLSRNSVALSWDTPEPDAGLQVRIVRNPGGVPATPADGVTVYQAPVTDADVCLDRNVGPGRHYYAAFLEHNGLVLTSAPAPALSVNLPPAADPFAVRVVATALLHPQAYGIERLPQVVLGPPSGRGLAWGSANVLSLGAATNDDENKTAPYGGAITLEFAGVVPDGPGPDFTVFENVFYIHNSAGTPDPTSRFMEPALVSVSQDGINWRQFPVRFSPRFDPATGELNLKHPYCYHAGFAGVNPVMSNGLDPDPTDPEVSGGDSFDIAELGLEWIRYVRIQSTGHLWLHDADGVLIHHTDVFGSADRGNAKAGFDLDAVAAVWLEKVAAQETPR